MRVVPLLVVLLCSLTAPAAPEMSAGPEPVVTAAAGFDEADYQALQQQADLARDMLARAQGQRVAALQLTVN